MELKVFKGHQFYSHINWKTAKCLQLNWLHIFRPKQQFYPHKPNKLN